MYVSFTPEGDWFVFDEDGKTVNRDFKTRDAAYTWVTLHGAT